MNNKYVLVLSKNQLHAINVAVEVLARLKIGQIKPALDQCLDKNGNSNVLSWEKETAIEAIIKPELGLSLNQSWGVGKFKIADLYWDLHEVIRNIMSWDNAKETGSITEEEYTKRIRSNKGLWTNNYDEPMHWNKDEDLAKVYSATIDQVTRINEFFD